jgi:hypothetical protein
VVIKILDSVGSKLALIATVGLVLVIIGVGIQTDVFSILNKGTSLNVYSIGDVLTNPQKYAGQKITVLGYYFQGDRPHGEGFISSELVRQPVLEGSLDNINMMLINISKINMVFNESAQYDFTGTLLKQGSPGVYPSASIILSVEKVELA